MINFFGKPVELLERSDLDILAKNEITEGLYMEYKEDFPQNLPKIVASFANTFGGWILIGVEARNHHNLPFSFPGIELTGGPKERFRHICRDGVNPVPLFTTKIVELPECPGRGVLIARIEESSYPPHITRDGRIYRRNSEGSDPVPETDRYILDRLFEKSRQNKGQVKALITQKIQEFETGIATIKVLSCPVPLNQNLIHPFFVDHIIKQIETKALQLWEGLNPAKMRFEPEGFTLENGFQALEILRSGMILYRRDLPVNKIETGFGEFYFLDHRSVKDAVYNTLRFARRIYSWANYMGQFIPKVALENIRGKGLDDPEYQEYYKTGADSYSRYRSITLPYWFTPMAVRELDHYGRIGDTLLQLVYRSFGFKVLDGKKFR
ncbi:MAG: helix-turn-helix domain-containing protein [Bacillota bacterium]